jgi:pimeloyl-ACP methyl ester carboxylesterase
MGVVVFVHAFGSSSRAWTPQVAGLDGRHRVSAPDLPGHGEAAEPFTLDRAVDTVRAAIDDSGEKTHLVGISGGAVVCLLAYLKHAPQVAGLVLSGGLARAPRWFVLQRAMTRLAPEWALARMMRGALSGGSADYAAAAVADFRRCGKSTFLNALDELADLDLRARLSGVAVPTLVLCGGDDRPNIPLSRELAAGIPTAELRLVPSANHLWNLQQPEVFNETVAAFVDKAGTPTL